MSVETDRELLEFAAKAAGYVIDEHARNGSAWAWVYPFGAKPDGDGDYPIFKWNPLHDDGDALRLAAKLKIDIEWQATNPFPEPRVEAYQRNDEGSYFCSDEHEDNYRRAIVRAAAEIGRAMP